MGRGQTDRHTDRHTYGHRDSMIESAQWADSMKIWMALYLSGCGGCGRLYAEIRDKNKHV